MDDDDDDQDQIELKSVEVFDPVQKRRYSVFVQDDLEVLPTEGTSDFEDEGLFTHEDNNQEPAITWSQNETLALINIVSLHKDTFRNFKVKKERWKLVSRELAKIGIDKLPQKCETKWRNLLRTYRIYKRGNKPPGKFEFFNELDQIISSDPQFKNIYDNLLYTSSSNPVTERANAVSQVKNDKMIYDPLQISNEDLQDLRESHTRKKRCTTCKSEKQKRHEERMVLLKKKLELEERKVRAFEEYVQFLKSTHSSTL